MANHYDFEGRVALVTGGASGIGAAVVERLRAGGGDVHVFDLSQGDDVRESAQLNAAVEQLPQRLSPGRNHDHVLSQVVENRLHGQELLRHVIHDQNVDFIFSCHSSNVRVASIPRGISSCFGGSSQHRGRFSGATTP